MDRSHFDRPPGTSVVLFIAALLFFASWLKTHYKTNAPIDPQHKHYAAN